MSTPEDHIVDSSLIPREDVDKTLGEDQTAHSYRVGNNEILDEKRAAQRFLKIIEPSDAYEEEMGGGNPKQKAINETRAAIEDKLEYINERYTIPQPDDSDISDLFMALKSLERFDATGKSALDSLLETNAGERADVMNNIDNYRYLAGRLDRGLGILSNAYERLLSKAPDVVDDFKHRHQSRLWDKIDLEQQLVGAVSDSLKLIKIYLGRETILYVVGDKDASEQSAAENLAAARKWLDTARDELLVKAGIVNPTTERTNKGALTKRENTIKDFRKMINNVSFAPKPGGTNKRLA